MRLKEGDLVQKCRSKMLDLSDIGIVLRIYNPKGRFTADVFWQNKQTYETIYTEYLLTIDEIEARKYIGIKKENKAIKGNK